MFKYDSESFLAKHYQCVQNIIIPGEKKPAGKVSGKEDRAIHAKQKLSVFISWAQNSTETHGPTNKLKKKAKINSKIKQSEKSEKPYKTYDTKTGYLL